MMLHSVIFSNPRRSSAYPQRKIVNGALLAHPKTEGHQYRLAAGTFAVAHNLGVNNQIKEAGRSHDTSDGVCTRFHSHAFKRPVLRDKDGAKNDTFSLCIRQESIFPA